LGRIPVSSVIIFSSSQVREVFFHLRGLIEVLKPKCLSNRLLK